jgi:hypothetical protein
MQVRAGRKRPALTSLLLSICDPESGISGHNEARQTTTNHYTCFPRLVYHNNHYAKCQFRAPRHYKPRQTTTIGFLPISTPERPTPGRLSGQRAASEGRRPVSVFALFSGSCCGAASGGASGCCSGGTGSAAPARLRAFRRLRRASAASLSIGVPPRPSSAPLRRGRCLVWAVGGGRFACCWPPPALFRPHAPLSPPLPLRGPLLGLGLFFSSSFRFCARAVPDFAIRILVRLAPSSLITSSTVRISNHRVLPAAAAPSEGEAAKPPRPHTFDLRVHSSFCETQNLHL